jgi:hypothetical protein
MCCFNHRFPSHFRCLTKPPTLEACSNEFHEMEGAGISVPCVLVSIIHRERERSDYLANRWYNPFDLSVNLPPQQIPTTFRPVSPDAEHEGCPRRCSASRRRTCGYTQNSPFLKRFHLTRRRGSVVFGRLGRIQWDDPAEIQRYWPA